MAIKGSKGHNMKELMKNIGKKAFYNGDDIQFEVEITDVRKVYGRIDYEIKPTAGKGSKWVTADSLKVQT